MGRIEVNGVQRYAPDEALSLIGKMLETAGLAVRKHYRGCKLTEIEAANLDALDRGDISISAEGVVIWEHETTISNDKEIRAIVDITKVLLATAAPSRAPSPGNQPLPGSSPALTLVPPTEEPNNSKPHKATTGNKSTDMKIQSCANFA